MRFKRDIIRVLSPLLTLERCHLGDAPAFGKCLRIAGELVDVLRPLFVITSRSSSRTCEQLAELIEKITELLHTTDFGLRAAGERVELAPPLRRDPAGPFLPGVLLEAAAVRLPCTHAWRERRGAELIGVAAGPAEPPCALDKRLRCGCLPRFRSLFERAPPVAVRVAVHHRRELAAFAGVGEDARDVLVAEV